MDFLLGANDRQVLLSGQINLGSDLTGVMIQVDGGEGGREGVDGEGECGAILEGFQSEWPGVNER